MSRPITQREVQLSNAAGKEGAAIMTSRQEAFFRVMQEANGLIVDRNILLLRLGMTKGSLRVVKYQVAELVKGYYEFSTIKNGGYQMRQV